MSRSALPTSPLAESPQLLRYPSPHMKTRPTRKAGRQRIIPCDRLLTQTKGKLTTPLATVDSVLAQVPEVAQLSLQIWRPQPQDAITAGTSLLTAEAWLSPETLVRSCPAGTRLSSNGACGTVYRSWASPGSTLTDFLNATGPAKLERWPYWSQFQP